MDRRKYLKDKIPFQNCLSICCGFGELERTLSKLNVAKRFEGVDIAQGAIEQARERARIEGFSDISYRVADLNIDNISQNTYDLIWANGALHHIKDLDRVIPMLYKALLPGGFLVANEYIGPNYQQVEIRQQEIISSAKHLLPDELKSLFGEQFIKSKSSMVFDIYKRLASMEHAQ